MNTLTATGWLVKEAWQTTVPVTYRQILCFDLMLQTGEGTEDPAPWRCEIDDEALGKKLQARLQPGAALIIRGELRTRAWQRNGVTEGFVRLIHVDRLEFSKTVREPEATP